MSLSPCRQASAPTWTPTSPASLYLSIYVSVSLSAGQRAHLDADLARLRAAVAEARARTRAHKGTDLARLRATIASLSSNG